MRMARKALNLLVDEDLVAQARQHGLVLSKFLENKLQEYFNFFNAVSSSPSSSNIATYGRGGIRTRDPWLRRPVPYPD